MSPKAFVMVTYLDSLESSEHMTSMNVFKTNHSCLVRSESRSGKGSLKITIGEGNPGRVSPKSLKLDDGTGLVNDKDSIHVELKWTTAAIINILFKLE